MATRRRCRANLRADSDRPAVPPPGRSDWCHTSNAIGFDLPLCRGAAVPFDASTMRTTYGTVTYATVG